MYLEDEILKLKQEHRKNKCVTFNKSYAIFLAILLGALFLPQLVVARQASGYEKSNWDCRCGYQNYGRVVTCPVCGREKPK